MLKKLLLIFILLLGAGYVTTYAKSNKNKGKSVFTMWQIPAYIGTNIGNSYVFKTQNGKVIVLTRLSSCAASSALSATRSRPGSYRTPTTTTWVRCGKFSKTARA